MSTALSMKICVFFFEFIKPTSQYEDARNGLKNLLDYFERSDMFKESIAEMKHQRRLF